MDEKQDAAPQKAPEGISPLDVMLITMRQAWERAHRLNDEGCQLIKDSLDLPQGPEREAMFRRGAEKIELADLAEKKALAISKDAAPYKHPKLANTNAQVSGDITIHRKTF